MTATETRSSVASNTAWLTAGRALVAILGWTGTVLVANELGQEEFGQFSLVFSILGMLSIVTDLGVGRIAVAALQRQDRDSATFGGNYIMLRIALGVVGYLLAISIVVLAGYPQAVISATAVGGIVVVLATPSNAYNIVFQVRNRLAPVAISKVVGQLGQMALTVALVLRGGSLVWFMVPAVLNDALILPWKVIAAHRLVDLRYKLDLSIWRELLREAVPLSAGAAFVTIYYRLDSLMLAELDSFEAVGSYAVGYKFVGLIHFLPSALSVALVAPLTAAWNDRDDAFERLFDSALRLLALGAGASLVVFWPFADELSALLYGEAYRDAGDAARILVTAEAFAFVSSLTITLLIATGRYRVYPKITFFGLVANVAVNLALIPAFSIEGAAVATLATELVVVVLLWRQCRSLPLDHRSATGIGVRLFVLTLVGIGTAFASAMVLPWVASAVVAVGMFLLGCHVSGLVSTRTLRTTLGGRGR